MCVDLSLKRLQDVLALRLHAQTGNDGRGCGGARATLLSASLDRAGGTGHRVQIRGTGFGVQIRGTGQEVQGRGYRAQGTKHRTAHCLTPTLQNTLPMPLREVNDSRVMDVAKKDPPKPSTQSRLVVWHYTQLILIQ